MDSSQAVNDLPAQQTATGLRWVLTHPGATYIAIHFQDFDLASGDAVIISDAAGGQAYHLTGLGKMNLGTFWAQHVTGDTAVLDLVTANHQPHDGFVIDEYAAGFTDLGGTASICGVDDQEDAMCRYPSVEYDRGRAVAKLLINGAGLCTGWLASADNHLITNEHCFEYPTETFSEQAANTDYIFGYEAASCGSVDPPPPGTVFSGATFIKSSSDLDYALLQINGDPQAEFEYLEIENRAPVVGEQIYVVSHPGGMHKQFAYNSTGDIGGVGRVLALIDVGPNLNVGYNNDTGGGSSGAPVIAVPSQRVIALHHSGGFDPNGWPSPCNPFNLGVPIDLICADIGENFCDTCIPDNELVGSTCQDGIDNDCDGFVDCEDVADCSSHSACRCYDNNGNSPLVCVSWSNGLPPQLNQDFTVDFIPNLGNPNGNPNVTFVTGNNGWKVWSQGNVENDSPADLGHLKIDPTLPTANFSVTVAHGALPGASYVASMSLVKAGWTGRSNLSGGSIAWDLEGDLVLQGTPEVSEPATFIIGGGVYGGVIDIPTVNTLEVKDGVSANTNIIIRGFGGGHRHVKLNTRSGFFEGQLSLPNGLPEEVEVDIHGLLTGTVELDGQLAGTLNLLAGSLEQSDINIGQLAPTGSLSMMGTLPLTYFGDLTLTSIDSGGGINIYGPSVTGSINVIEDWKGSLISDGIFGGIISIGGSLSDTGSLVFRGSLGATSGDIVIEQNCEGSVEINGNMAGDISVGGNLTGSLAFHPPQSGGMYGDILIGQNSDGNITVDSGTIAGEVHINGVMNGNLCAMNFSAAQALPLNIQIGCGIGTTGTICLDALSCSAGNIVSSLAQPPHGTRDGRQPYPMGQSGAPVPVSSRQGIGSPNPDAGAEDKIIMTLNNSGLRAISHDCWSICETGTEPVDTGTPPLSPNKISCLAEQGVGGDEYQIKLDRPISAKHWTTIRYGTGAGAVKVSYASLPGNINGDNYVNSTDMLWRIDCMNGITSHCGTTVYTQDLDHSGAFASNVDYGFAWVDLWNGAGNFIQWQQKSLPANSCIGGGGSGGPPCPVAPCGPDPGPQMAMFGGGGGGAEFESMAGALIDSGGEEALQEALLEGELIEPEPSLEEQNAEVADWIVDYLVAADPQGDEAIEVFDTSITMVTQWCVEQFSAEEKSTLALRLLEPATPFGSALAAAAAENIIFALSP